MGDAIVGSPVPNTMRRLQANTDIAAWRLVDGEAVIVHADTSAYYGLNSSATFIWESILAEPLAARELAERVGARFGVAGDAAERDVESFLAALEAEGLVRETTNAGAADARAALASQPASPARYEPPRLDRFGELEQLVLSGE